MLLFHPDENRDTVRVGKTKKGLPDSSGTAYYSTFYLNGKSISACGPQNDKRDLSEPQRDPSSASGGLRT